MLAFYKKNKSAACENIYICKIITHSDKPLYISHHLSGTGVVVVQIYPIDTVDEVSTEVG